MNKYALGALLGCWLLNATGQEAIGQEIDRTIDADPNAALVVNNVAGSIEIRGSDERQVHVTGRLGGNVERLDVLNENESIVVKVVLKDRGRSDGRFNFGESDTDLRIRAPRTMALEVSAVSADVDVGDMRGEQRIGAVSGDVRTQAYGAEIRVQSVSGDLDIAGSDEPIVASASAVSGDLSIRGTAGDVRAESVSGDIEIEGGTVNRVDARSVSGDIGIRAALSTDARIDAMSTSGDIELGLGDNADGTYRLATFSGEIHNCFGPRPADQDNRPPGTELRFSEGKAGARVDIRTHSGDIDVCKD